MNEQFKDMETYCQNDTCGDPVPSINGVVYYKSAQNVFYWIFIYRGIDF